MRKLAALASLLIGDIDKHRKRMFLTVSAIAWGTLSILLLLSFGEGLKQQMGKSSKGLGINIVILFGGQTSKIYQGLPKGRRIRFTPEDAMLLKERIPEILKVSPEFDVYGATFTYKNKTLTERFTGAGPAFEDMRTHYPDWGGRFINQSDVENRRRVIFLGTELKERLFGEEPAIGKIISINNIPFTVIGVMIEKLQMSMYGGPDSNKGSIPFTTFQSLFGRRYVNRIIYQVENADIAPYVERQVWRVFGSKYKFDQEDSEAIWVWDVVQQNKVGETIMVGIQIFLGLIGTLTLLIASVGVANTMYVAVKERTREIGVKRALGARKVHIKVQFIMEAGLVSILGGIIGTVLAMIIIQILQGIPIEDGPLQFLGKPTFSVPIAVTTASILSLISLLAGYFPARKAAKISPVEALRYE